MKNRNVIKVRAKKYEYTLERVKAESDQIAGCLHCFFCKKRNGYFVQTCGSVKDTNNRNVTNCGSIFKGNHTIYKMVSKEKIL